ncbi:cytosolic 5'-nucleotidase 1A isoform X1 [Lates calcarifer]|uniref:5'-nucleotidase, cytosolic IA n=1 Tax=Lates calcarifer TaxID=8187 RepID=A0A4W6CCH4_LATCA|nr:cytosolic 5'-nucleotidase 1A isoform X1 [Lates calcarifer]
MGKMSCKTNQCLTNPGQDVRRMGCSGEDAEMGRDQKQEPEIPVTIAMSSELLFNTEQQSPGPGYSFVKALKAVNAKLTEHYPQSEELFKVLLIHDNSSELSERFIKNHKLEELITPFYVSGEHLVGELQENETHLYLSAQPGFKVQEVLNKGIAAAIMYTPEETTEVAETQLRVVFDGDAVLFSDESERVFATKGLESYLNHENERVNEPMTEGPFKGFLQALGKLQKKFFNKGQQKCPIRTYLLTSRDAAGAGYRALNTLKTWGLEIDEAYFLGGSPKGPLLKMIRPHIFFDDQMRHVDGSLKEGIVACHVLAS